MPVSARHRLEWCLARIEVIDTVCSWFSWKCSGICKRQFFSGVFPDSQAVQVSAEVHSDTPGEQVRVVVPERWVLGVVLAGIPVDHGSAVDRPDNLEVLVRVAALVRWSPDAGRVGIPEDHGSAVDHPDSLGGQASVGAPPDNPADLGHAVVPVHEVLDVERAGVPEGHGSVADRLGNLGVRTDGPVRQDLAEGLLRLVPAVSGSSVRTWEPLRRCRVSCKGLFSVAVWHRLLLRQMR